MKRIHVKVIPTAAPSKLKLGYAHNDLLPVSANHVAKFRKVKYKELMQ
jgi:hypothetical protein